MSSDELRDAIYEAVAHLARHRGPFATVMDIVDAILDMPEMEAIRNVIWQLCEQGDWNMSSSEMLSLLGLPESVIDWVLGEEARRG